MTHVLGNVTTILSGCFLLYFLRVRSPILNYIIFLSRSYFPFVLWYLKKRLKPTPIIIIKKRYLNLKEKIRKNYNNIDSEIGFIMPW